VTFDSHSVRKQGLDRPYCKRSHGSRHKNNKDARGLSSLPMIPVSQGREHESKEQFVLFASIFIELRTIQDGGVKA
jgi:hypothetical protein